MTAGGGAGAAGDAAAPVQAETAPETVDAAGAAPRRWRDLAILLPIFGLGLLLPPIIDVAGAAGPVLGLPAGVVYVFGVWAALILVAARMSRPLARGRAPKGREPGEV